MPVQLFNVNTWIRQAWQAVPEFQTVHLMFDGIGVSGTGSNDLVLLGDDGDPDTEVSSEYEQTWVDMGQTRKEERGVIPCAVITNSGDTYQPQVMQRALELLNLAMAPIENDRSMGGLVYTSDVLTGTARTITNEKGTAVIVPFDVTYWTHA
jgi:hypothetical protein